MAQALLSGWADRRSVSLCRPLAGVPLQVFSALMLAYGLEDMILMFRAEARIDFGSIRAHLHGNSTRETET